MNVISIGTMRFSLALENDCMSPCHAVAWPNAFFGSLFSIALCVSLHDLRYFTLRVMLSSLQNPS